MNRPAKTIFSRLNQRNAVILLLLSVFCFFSTTTPAWAQRDALETRVKNGLQDLKEAIAKAKEIIATVDNRQARDFLANAETALHEAETKYNRALTLNDIQLRELLLKEALASLMIGKGFVERALKLALEVPLTRLRTRLDELMRRAEQSVLSQNNREAQRLVYQARKTQLDAERVLMRDPRRAFELYQIAIALVEKALSLVEGRNREKENYENLEKRASEAVETSKKSAAFSVFQQAQKQARTAEESLRKGEIVLAQQLYRGATRLLLRAMDLAMAGRKAQDYGRNEAALLQDLIGMAEQELQENSDPRASLFLTRARVLVREAEAALERQQPLEAKWRLELARNFVGKAMRKVEIGALNKENLSQRYAEALQELSRDIAEVGSRAREANNPEATALVELAVEAYKAAENAGRQNRLIVGFQLLRMAQHLLLRAETMLRESPVASGSAAPAREAVLQRLTQVENAAKEISSATDPEACQTVRAQALEMIVRSRAELERGQIRLALAIAEVATDLLENCLRK
jgi:hypothetical protein